MLGWIQAAMQQNTIIKTLLQYVTSYVSHGKIYTLVYLQDDYFVTFVYRSNTGQSFIKK